MSETINTDKIISLKKELSAFVKQKDDLFADYMRLEGIIAYLSNQLNVLDPNQSQASKPVETTKQPKK